MSLPPGSARCGSLAPPGRPKRSLRESNATAWRGYYHTHAQAHGRGSSRRRGPGRGVLGLSPPRPRPGHGASQQIRSASADPGQAGTGDRPQRGRLCGVGLAGPLRVAQSRWRVNRGVGSSSATSTSPSSRSFASASSHRCSRSSRISPRHCGSPSADRPTPPRPPPPRNPRPALPRPPARRSPAVSACFAGADAGSYPDSHGRPRRPAKVAHGRCLVRVSATHSRSRCGACLSR